MKEIKHIYNAYHTHIGRQKMALATVVQVEGSSYRRVGARMLVFDDGNWVGGVSGGCLEGDALIKSKRAILNQYPSIITYDTREDDDYQIGVGLGCNGLIKVMFVPLQIEMDFHPINILKEPITSRSITSLYHIIQCKEPSMLGRVYHPSNVFLLIDYLKEMGFNSTNQLTHNYSPKSKIERFETQTESIEILIESIKPTIRILLLGHNKDLIGMCQCASQLGWAISVFGRISKMPKEVFEFTQDVYEYEEITESAFDDYTALVLMTHDLDRDVKILSNLNTDTLKYVGIMGPRTRYDKLIEKLSLLKNPNFNKSNNSYAPIGLDLGAVLPEEIHISIAAEIIAVFNGRKGKSLRERIGPIND